MLLLVNSLCLLFKCSSPIDFHEWKNGNDIRCFLFIRLQFFYKRTSNHPQIWCSFVDKLWLQRLILHTFSSTIPLYVYLMVHSFRIDYGDLSDGFFVDVPFVKGQRQTINQRRYCRCKFILKSNSNLKHSSKNVFLKHTQHSMFLLLLKMSTYPTIYQIWILYSSQKVG